MRTLLLLALWCSLIGRAAALTGTYYDTSTGEYLTLDESSGKMVVRYSNGERPFVRLLLRAEREADVPEGPYSGPSHYYSVAFAASPKTIYTLALYQHERNGIDCTDANGNLENQYSFISRDVFDKPDYLGILYAIGPIFTTDDDSVSLTLADGESEFSITLTFPDGERNLRVQSLVPKENKIIFSDDGGHGPYELTVFDGIKYRTPGLSNDVLYLQAPGKALITLHN
jgi:hypothetical protein